VEWISLAPESIRAENRPVPVVEKTSVSSVCADLLVVSPRPMSRTLGPARGLVNDGVRWIVGLSRGWASE